MCIWGREKRIEMFGLIYNPTRLGMYGRIDSFQSLSLRKELETSKCWHVHITFQQMYDVVYVGATVYKRCDLMAKCWND
jgi:hypothetical protein